MEKRRYNRGEKGISEARRSSSGIEERRESEEGKRREEK